MFESFITKFLKPVLVTRGDNSQQFLTALELTNMADIDLQTYLRQCKTTYIQLKTENLTSIAILHISRPDALYQPYLYELNCVTNSASEHENEEGILG